MSHYVTTKLSFISAGRYTIEHQHHYDETLIKNIGNVVENNDGVYTLTQIYTPELSKHLTENIIIKYAYSKRGFIF